VCSWVSSTNQSLFAVLETIPNDYIGTGVMPLDNQALAIGFTRASSRSCELYDGTWVTLTTDQPCVTANGLLIEDAATNLLLRSEELDNATWTASGDVVAAPTVTANSTDVLDPYGTNVAEKVAFPDVTGAGATSVVSQDFTATAAAHTASVWMRSDSGSKIVNLIFKNGGTYHFQDCTVTTSWNYCVLERKTLTGATWSFQIGVDLDDVGQVSRNPGTLYIIGAQVVAQGRPHTYIKTTGTQVSTASEYATNANRMPGGSTTICMAATITPVMGGLWSGSVSNARGIGSMGGYPANNSISYYIDNNATAVTYRVWDNAGGLKQGAVSSMASTGATHRLKFCNTSGTFTGWKNASASSVSTSGAGTGLITSMPATFYLGRFNGSTGNALNGYVKYFCYDNEDSTRCPQ
jgi:hypothetical protein